MPNVFGFNSGQPCAARQYVGAGSLRPGRTSAVPVLQQRYELSYGRCRGKASPTGLGRAVGKLWKGNSGWTLGRWAGGPSLPKSLPSGVRLAWEGTSWWWAGRPPHAHEPRGNG